MCDFESIFYGLLIRTATWLCSARIMERFIDGYLRKTAMIKV